MINMIYPRSSTYVTCMPLHPSNKTYQFWHTPAPRQNAQPLPAKRIPVPVHLATTLASDENHEAKLPKNEETVSKKIAICLVIPTDIQASLEVWYLDPPKIPQTPCQKRLLSCYPCDKRIIWDSCALLTMKSVLITSHITSCEVFTIHQVFIAFQYHGLYETLNLIDWFQHMKFHFWTNLRNDSL